MIVISVAFVLLGACGVVAAIRGISSLPEERPLGWLEQFRTVEEKMAAVELESREEEDTARQFLGYAFLFIFSLSAVMVGIVKVFIP